MKETKWGWGAQGGRRWRGREERIASRVSMNKDLNLLELEWSNQISTDFIKG